MIDYQKHLAAIEARETNGEQPMNYTQRDIESLGNLYLRHVEAMTAEGLYSKSDIAAELAWRDAEIEKLAKFKAYVHQRLDDAGIPKDPESPHKAEGCRIGGRLDIVLTPRMPRSRAAQLADQFYAEDSPSRNPPAGSRCARCGKPPMPFSEMCSSCYREMLKEIEAEEGKETTP